jgi:hypothetical protein
MMHLGEAGLIAAYVALAVLLLSLNLASRWPWWVKTAATLVLAGFFFVTYDSLPRLMGWPTDAEPPGRLYLVGIDVAEPDWVYLWARDLDQGLTLSTPRAYRLHYTKTLHRDAEAAGRKLRKALPVVVEVDSAPLNAVAVEEGQTATNREPQIRFLDAPEGLIPEKE